MKKFLPALIAILFVSFIPAITHKADAQIVKTITIAAADDTLVSADTAIVSLTFDGSYKSVEGTIYELTGTIGGKIIFQGQLPDGQWAGLDSFSLVNTDSLLQFKLFTVPNPRLHAAYRLYFLKSGTGSAPIKAYYVRYTGGAILRNDPNSGLASIFKPGNEYRDLSKPSFTSNYITGYNNELSTVGRFRLTSRIKLQMAS